MTIYDVIWQVCITCTNIGMFIGVAGLVACGVKGLMKLCELMITLAER